MAQERLLIFGDPGLGSAGLLTQVFLERAARREDMEVVAVCDAGRRPEPPWAAAKRALRIRAQRWFNPSPKPRSQRLRPTIQQAARRGATPLIVPPRRNVNSPEFLIELDRLRPTLALSVGCLQIFREPLLERLGYVVNFHDGALPHYRGLAATSWSIFDGEPASGFSFHWMTPGIDEGAVLLSGSTPVRPDDVLHDVLDRKLELAASAADAVLERMARRDPGEPQEFGGAYFSAADRRRICRVADPSLETSEELRHRLRAFALLELQLGGSWYEVTAFDASGRGLAFRCADGVELTVRRAMFLPVGLYRVYRAVRDWRGGGGLG